MTVTDLDTKLDAIKTGVDALKVEIAALKNQPPAAASAEQIEALNVKADAIVAALGS